mmetsp:Transcript_33366/g.33992  ORF Transcript_33366/g.33992 Transcript_33366/m.33992 type:complete len:362 (+) Transcript_33366:122-1207(+)|eukprot:CAMPEP_0182418994 /NCGR_PEP_ID=MMETSP1167-20130531/3373_1 /TAXON_ID=2988 /ORGANISM="Mallomonas Sp, Strain CCMP3275" /LENGTH=361 /DNA_ID=CAMNT_0024593521 /DNA_START=114 /DNA_END=1199 /DNA_ORIENTATION=+
MSAQQVAGNGVNSTQGENHNLPHMHFDMAVKLAEIHSGNLNEQKSCEESGVSTPRKAVRKSIARVEVVDPMKEHEKRMKTFMKKFTHESEENIGSRSNSVPENTVKALAPNSSNTNLPRKVSSSTLPKVPSSANMNAVGGNSPRGRASFNAGGSSPRPGSNMKGSLSPRAGNRSHADLKALNAQPVKESALVKTLSKASIVKYDSNWQEVGNYKDMLEHPGDGRSEADRSTADLLKNVQQIKGTTDIEAALRMVAQLEAQLAAASSTPQPATPEVGQADSGKATRSSSLSHETTSAIAANEAPSRAPEKQLSKAIINKYYGDDTDMPERKVVGVTTIGGDKKVVPKKPATRKPSIVPPNRR